MSGALKLQANQCFNTPGNSSLFYLRLVYVFRRPCFSLLHIQQYFPIEILKHHLIIQALHILDSVYILGFSIFFAQLQKESNTMDYFGELHSFTAY